MKALLIDVWHDLRAKRLWPVAALLALVLVALPVVVLKPAEEAPPAASGLAGIGGSSTAEKAIVALAEDAGVDASRLDAFRAKDPFRAPRAARPPAEGDGAAGADPGDDAGKKGGDAGDGDAAPGGAPAGGSPSAEAPAGGGEPGAGGDPNAGGGAAPKPPRRVSYTHTVDLRFGRRGAERVHRSVQRLDVLPRDGDAQLVFLGVSPTRKSALFLVDASLEQHGDGRCEPSPRECSFLRLTLERGHDLHFFTTESGTEYALRLLDIKRERTDALARRAREARAAERRRARTSEGTRRERRGFTSPLLAGDETVDGDR